MTLDIVISWLIGLLGVSFYVTKEIHSKIKVDRKLDIRKLFKQNQMFWLVTIILNLIISIILTVTPEASKLIGYAVNLDTNIGYFIIGYILAGGANSSTIWKNLSEKKQEL